VEAKPVSTYATNMYISGFGEFDECGCGLDEFLAYSTFNLSLLP